MICDLSSEYLSAGMISEGDNRQFIRQGIEWLLRHR